MGISRLALGGVLRGISRAIVTLKQRNSERYSCNVSSRWLCVCVSGLLAGCWLLAAGFCCCSSGRSLPPRNQPLWMVRTVSASASGWQVAALEARAKKAVAGDTSAGSRRRNRRNTTSTAAALALARSQRPSFTTLSGQPIVRADAAVATLSSTGGHAVADMLGPSATVARPSTSMGLGSPSSPWLAAALHHPAGRSLSQQLRQHVYGLADEQLHPRQEMTVGSGESSGSSERSRRRRQRSRFPDDLWSGPLRQRSAERRRAEAAASARWDEVAGPGSPHRVEVDRFRREQLGHRGRLVHHRRCFREDSRWVLDHRWQQQRDDGDGGSSDNAEHMWHVIEERQAQERARIVAYSRRLSSLTGAKGRVSPVSSQLSGSDTDDSFALLGNADPAPRGGEPGVSNLYAVHFD
jgi:hypothetical protein